MLVRPMTGDNPGWAGTDDRPDATTYGYQQFIDMLSEIPVLIALAHIEVHDDPDQTTGRMVVYRHEALAGERIRDNSPIYDALRTLADAGYVAIDEDAPGRGYHYETTEKGRAFCRELYMDLVAAELPADAGGDR